MFTFIPMWNGFRRAAPLALIAALGLAACGRAYNGGDTVYGMPTSGGAGSKAFAADSGHSAIGSLINPNPAPGTIMVDRTIMGIYTQLSSNIGSLALDTANDRLYVGNGTSILVFNSASQANGNIYSDRVVTGTFPLISNTGSLFLDTGNNRLYVGDGTVGVRVFDSASTINGATPSTRLITGNFGTTFTIHGVAVDTTSKNILYVSNDTITPSSSHQISVFDSASTVTGSNPPNRTITPTITALNFNVGGIFLDAANDRLYVAGGSVNQLIMVFDGASALDGAIAPTKTLTMPAVITSVVVDAVNDRLSAVSANAIYIVENVSTLMSGPATAKAIGVPALGTFTAVAVSP